MTLLNMDEINKHLTKLPGWSLKKNAIEREWVFKDFKEALRFINKIGQIAENHNHHPEIYNVYSKVKLRFNTHDEGGITLKDIKIATEINAL
jgi:4a-hydroxytetrahydrobiopterin dehydratase